MDFVFPIAELFSEDYAIILYDSRNHGKSAPSITANLMDRAKDLAALIRELGLLASKQNGHSLGAVTITLFAGIFPNVPACAVLENPPSFEMFAAKNPKSLEFSITWHEIAAKRIQNY